MAIAILLTILSTGCSESPVPDTRQSTDPNTEPTAPQADPVAVARHVAGARVAALRGDRQAAQAHVEGIQREVMQEGRMPDPRRPIDREMARAAVREIDGVRSVIWLDRHNLLVMIDGAGHRTQAMINRVCAGMAPLGDTLAVVVNLQDVTATTGAAAQTLSRNCQLPSGERAFMVRPREVDVVPESLRHEFQRQQQPGG